MMKNTMIATMLCLTAGACGSDDSEFTEALAGVWADCDNSDARFTFGADGAFAFDEGEPGTEGWDHVVGTFSADETTVFAEGVSEDDVDVDYEFTYYVAGDELLVGAAHPVGDHDGLVGTWRARLHVVPSNDDPFGADTEFDLRADGSGTMSSVYLDGSPDALYDGTWAEDDEAPGYVFRFVVGEDGDTITYNIHFQLVDDAVLGVPEFCKQ
jgi:hypothetical protein